MLLIFLHFYFLPGGLDTSEPWQGEWNGGVLVECVGRPGPEVNRQTGPP